MTNKHPCAEIIKAKADNMSLVVFCNGPFWHVIDRWPSFFEDFDYFACLPQHKEAVLNVLNGGDSQVNYIGEWSECNCGARIEWGRSWWYMDDKCQSRAKPRKEKRWIAIRKSDLLANEYTFKSRDDAIADLNPKYWDFHELEIEV
jgi:hypothetical protein